MNILGRNKFLIAMTINKILLVYQTLTCLHKVICVYIFILTQDILLDGDKAAYTF